MPSPSWKALDHHSGLTNSPTALHSLRQKVLLGAKEEGEGEWERERERWFFQASRRHLNSVGRSAVWNRYELGIAITQSRQSVKYAFFFFILHHFYETSVSMQQEPLAQALQGWQIYY